MNRYIGLERGTSTCACTLADDEDTCRACRATWGWEDDTQVTEYNGWMFLQPDGTAACGLLTRSGWSAMTCGGAFQAICEAFECKFSLTSHVHNKLGVI